MKLLVCSGLTLFSWLISTVISLANRPTAITPPNTQPFCYAAAPAPLLFTPSLNNPFPPVFFCGEAVPLHEEAVARRLISALSRNSAQARSMIRLRQRAAAFFPVIEPVLARYHIPLDFKYLPLVESALVGSAISTKGAAGYWQLMPETARELGLTVDFAHDERLDLLRSTDAACRYLRFLYTKLGSWTLAAAAYNNGIGNLLSNIRRQQSRNYYYLRLNAETGKYLYRILAFKELFMHPLHYREWLSEPMLASLDKPVTQEALTQTAEVLFDENVMVNLEREAVTSPLPLAEVTGAALSDNRPEELSLPNAANLFQGGIKARLLESGTLQRGSVWVFNLMRASLAGEVTISEGDRLYAVVEDVDVKTNKVYFRADKIHTGNQHETLNLPLIAVDATTGRMGINAPDLTQLKAGRLLTWKAL